MEHAGPRRAPGDPYQVLGVGTGASQQDIARAYRRAVQHAHPDARPRDPQAAARFLALTAAYGLLGDPDRRAGYDRGHPAAEPSSRPPWSGQPVPASRGRGSPFLLGPPPGQLICAGPVHIEPPATARAASQPGRSTAPAHFEDPAVILRPRPGQVRGWPW